MLDINFIRQNTDKFEQAMNSRGLAFKANLILDLDINLRYAQTELQKEQGKKNQFNKPISSFTDIEKTEAERIKISIGLLDKKVSELKTKLDSIMHTLPNIPEESVPIGHDETSNIEISLWMEDKRKISDNALEHFEIGAKLGMMDFESAVQMSGSRFVILKNQLAELERALANFMIEHNVLNGYQEISVPVLVKPHAMFGVGQLPKFSEDSFETTDGYRLIPTAEVSLANMLSNKIISQEELPIRLSAISDCFRSEVGSAGKDIKGMFRMHQFKKVELFSFTTESTSKTEHERMLETACSILKKLEIPHRVMLLSTGDMGFASQKTYDIEVWLPGQKRYREISSCSNCGPFQARRLSLKYKTTDGKKHYLHTLNGSALAIGRTIIAILENFYDGNSVIIPNILQKYMGNKEKIGI